MTGNLVMDKTHMNFSDFLYTIGILDIYGGRMSKHDFIKEMAGFLGVPAQINGRENAVPYQKSKLPRYFGLISTETDAKKGKSLVLTRRGKWCSRYLMEKKDVRDASDKYYIQPENRERFLDLLFYSVLFDSFGRNNDGVERSHTDVEPPKVIFKLLFQLGQATAEEIYYVIYGMNLGVFLTFDTAVKQVISNRFSGRFDYSSVMETWGIAKIVHECNLLPFLADDNVGLLLYQENYYSLSNRIRSIHGKHIERMDTIYQPWQLLLYTDSKHSDITPWLYETILGGVEQKEFLFYYDTKNAQTPLCSEEGTFFPGALEQALTKALQFPKKNCYLVIEHLSEEDITHFFGPYAILFKRINELANSQHGWSEQSVQNIECYQYLVEFSKDAEKKLPYGMIKLPPNFHIIGIINRNHMEQNRNFDYEFKRCLVTSESEEALETRLEPQEHLGKRLETGCNVLLYGVPGSGKSWTIEHEYRKPGSKAVRLVFHPDYTYSDFVGQILPKVADNGQVSYQFTPGPFTRILKEAYYHPDTEYLLIIEEINRGNAPAIFGELFQLLDRKMAMQEENDDGFPIGTSEYGIINTDMAAVIYGRNREEEEIRIPSNLSIIGTMNTSDQNVFTLDTAFQRRWDMRLIENNFEHVAPEFANAMILDTGVTWKNFCMAINDLILANGVGMAAAEDKRMGVYFVSFRDLQFDERMGDFTTGEYDALCKKERVGIFTAEEKKRLFEIRDAMKQNRRFPEKVIKYLWDDAFRFNREVIFESTEYQSLEQLIHTFLYATGMERWKIFRENIRNAFHMPKM